MVAYVYLLEEIPHPDEKTGSWTKIGYTKNPVEWRLNTNIKMGNSRVIKLAAVYKFETDSEALAAEKEAHIRFVEYLMRKEWFNISWETVAEWCNEERK